MTHASDAAALFTAEEDEEIEFDIDGEGGERDEQNVNEWDSRGGSPVDEGDLDAIPVRYLLFLKGRITLI
jgi:hypothetical protein